MFRTIRTVSSSATRSIATGVVAFMRGGSDGSRGRWRLHGKTMLIESADGGGA